jgi:hypothetical protein
MGLGTEGRFQEWYDRTSQPMIPLAVRFGGLGLLELKPRVLEPRVEGR